MLYETLNGYKLLVKKFRATEIADYLVQKGIQVYEIRYPYSGDKAFVMISAHKEEKSKIADVLLECAKNEFQNLETDNLPY